LPDAAAARASPSRAQVTEGSGRVLVLAVGPNSEWGRTMALVQGESVDTPLQEKLGVLASAIGKLGLVVAVICFLVLLIRCGVGEEREGAVERRRGGALASCRCR
jgi:Ca2+-transporting ATPase